MEYDLITVAETEPFYRKVSRLLTEDEKAELITYLSSFPNSECLSRELVVFENSGGPEVVVVKVVEYE